MAAIAALKKVCVCVPACAISVGCRKVDLIQMEHGEYNFKLWHL